MLVSISIIFKQEAGEGNADHDDLSGHDRIQNLPNGRLSRTSLSAKGFGVATRTLQTHPTPEAQHCAAPRCTRTALSDHGSRT